MECDPRRVFKDPGVSSKLEVEEHNIGHTPYRSWCPICAASRGVSGRHMWVQALVSGRWLDLDPTRTLDFDAGHLLVSTSALQRGGGQEQLSGILPLLGRLEIEVLEIDGRSPKEGQR